MDHILRNLLVSAAVGLSVPSMMAQSESFTGPSGLNYFVDYESGLIMQLGDNSATLVSPKTVVEKEFWPISDQIYSLAVEHDSTLEALRLDAADYQLMLDTYQTENDAYETIRQNFMDAGMVILQNYVNIIDIIEQIGNTRSSGKTVARAKNTQPTSFRFDIAGILAELDFVSFQVRFTREYLDDFKESILDFSERLQEGGDEIEEIQISLGAIIDQHSAYAQYVYGWLEQYGAVASEDDLYDLAMDVQDMASDLQLEMEYVPSNPVDYLTTWINISNDYLQSTIENYNEGVEMLENLSEKFYFMQNYFCDVLFAGTNGEEFGMYFNIMADGGKLVLPDAVSIEGKEYEVTGAEGNVFSCVPETFSMEGLRLILPAHIATIKDEAFAIDGITSVTVNTASVPQLESNCFTSDVYKKATLYVDEAQIETYKSNASWSRFLNISGTSGVGETNIAEANVRMEGNWVIVDRDGAVGVYTVDGKIVYSGMARRIELPGSGLYFIKTDNSLMKVKL